MTPCTITCAASFLRRIDRAPMEQTPIIFNVAASIQSGRQHQSTMSILIVDDDFDTVVSKALLLRHHGYSVATCMQPEQVVAIIKRIRPKLVLLDLSMPNVSGFDIANELKTTPE